MGQTLTHGVYLPDEGERNCYNGLAANWQLLDNSVGTIADHTTALAGKAPAVHTHSKADITDLFNSANTWTGDNTYTKYLNVIIAGTEIGVAPTNQNRNGLLLKDKNNETLGWMRSVYDTTGDLSIEMLVTNKYSNGALNPDGTQTYQGIKQTLTASGDSYFSWSGKVNNHVIPRTNNTYDLGSSSYQWNNVYSKNYYYNGTAWGLDKVNTWSAQQKIVGNNSRGTVSIYNPTYTKGNALSSTDLSIGSIYMGDGGQQGLANSLTFISTDLAANGAKTLLSLSAMENTASSGARTNVVIQYDKNDAENPKKVSIGGTAQPNPDATFSLGTSSFRWKTLNGINPGALSLPSATVKNIDTFDWNFSWNANIVTAPFDGYISIACFGSALQINNETKSYAMTFAPGSDGFICGLLPVSSGDSIKVLVTRTQTSQYEGYKFIKSCGNVS